MWFSYTGELRRFFVLNATPAGLFVQLTRLISTNDAAKYLGCERSTVRRLVLGGELPVITRFKHWKLDVRDLDTFIAANKIGGAQ